MNAEAIKRNADVLSDEMCKAIAVSKVSPLTLADKALDDPNLSDEGKTKILYVLVMTAQIIAEKAFRVAALAILARDGDADGCPCEKCRAARDGETVQ